MVNQQIEFYGLMVTKFLFKKKIIRTCEMSTRLQAI